MPVLVVIGYPDAATAEKARDEIFGLSPDDLAPFSQLSEAVVATRDKKGSIKLSHLVHLWPLKTGAGSIWGLLVGAIFLHPIFGVLAGGAAGLIAGALTDCGVDEEFIKALDDLLQPGKAALLLKHETSTPFEVCEPIIEKLAPFDGRILRTNLNAAMEHRLRQALEDAHCQTKVGKPLLRVGGGSALR